jgi:hypothetical protein
MLLVVVVALRLVWGSWGSSHSNGGFTVSCRVNNSGCNIVFIGTTPPPFSDPSFWGKKCGDMFFFIVSPQRRCDAYIFCHRWSCCFDRSRDWHLHSFCYVLYLDQLLLFPSTHLRCDAVLSGRDLGTVCPITLRYILQGSNCYNIPWHESPTEKPF